MKCKACGRVHAIGVLNRLIARAGEKLNRLGHNSTLRARFLARVNKVGGCWLWTGSTHSNGYGVILVAGNGSSLRPARRVSWELHIGRIPKGHFVNCKCKNPTCVNPAHLFTSPKAHPLAGQASRRLTPDQVRTLRAVYATGRVTLDELGAKYGITGSGASLIVHRQRYADVD